MMGHNERPENRDRRRVLRGLATGIAGAVAAPTGAAGETSRRPQRADPAPAVGPAPERFLNEHDSETLARLAELLVPGSEEAGVPVLLDRVLAVDSSEVSQSFLSALRAFEGQARARHGSRFVELDDAERIAVLRDASSEQHALHDAFVEVRARVTSTYFATEPGMRKLGWIGRSAWRELPKCTHVDDDHR